MSSALPRSIPLTALGRRYLKNRKFNTSLKNVAGWGYWKNTGMYGTGTSRENAPFFEALSGTFHEFGKPFILLPNRR